MRNGTTLWICEKWSDEACKFTEKKLERVGVTHLPGAFLHTVKMIPIKHAISSAALRQICGPPEECTEVVGNLLLNEGIQRLQDLTMVTALLTNQTATNCWGSTGAFLGVGTSNTAEAATQTDLQAGGFYKAMNSTFPSRSGQTVSFVSDFTGTEANQVWAEWSVSAAATGASGAGFTTGTTNLQRKVAALGTKASGTWTLTAQVTFS